MKGKDKCRALKEIRRKIAEENDIEYAVSECSHKGDCKGTCPKCEAELRYLERELEKKRRIGEKVAIAGISMGAMTALAGCNPVEAIVVTPMKTVINTIQNAFDNGEDDIAGEIEVMGDEPYYVENDPYTEEMGEPVEEFPLEGTTDPSVDSFTDGCGEDGEDCGNGQDGLTEGTDGEEGKEPEEEVYALDGDVAMPFPDEE